MVVPLTMPMIPVKLIGGQCLLERLNNGNAAPDTALKTEVQVAVFCGFEQQFMADFRHHFFVGGDDILARSASPASHTHAQAGRRRSARRQYRSRVVEHIFRTVREQARVDCHSPRLCRSRTAIFLTHDRAADFARDSVGILGQHLHRAAADDAQPEYSNVDLRLDNSSAV